MQDLARRHRITMLVFHYFFVIRIVIALWAFFIRYEAKVPYWGGPKTWLLVQAFYVYLPLCIAFVVYSLYLVSKQRWRHRLVIANWILFLTAIGAEVLYLTWP